MFECKDRLRSWTGLLAHGVWALGTALALWSASGQAQAQTPACTARAGWIVKVDGAVSDVQIQRGQTTILGAPWTALCAGDRVEVARATAAHLRLNWQAEPQIVGGAQAFAVNPPVDQNAQMGSNAWSYIRQRLLPDLERMIGHARMRDYHACESAGGADQALRYGSPGLADGAAQVPLASARDGLTFCWNGGAGPYQIAVWDGAGVEQYRVTGISGRAYATRALPLSPGRWRVTLSDSAGARAEGAFQVVAAEPPTPPGWDAREYDDSIRVLWLARCQGREWGFTALQLVSSRRAGSVPSSVMYELLSEYADQPPNC